MLKIYGPMRSRTARVLWMLEECGAPYEHDDLARYATMAERTAAVQKLYPLGKVPFLTDGDVLLAESMAINVYLARKYAPQLWPRSESDQARALQWSIFAVTEIDPPLVQLMMERLFHKDAERDVANEKKNAELIRRPLAYLEQTRGDMPYLLGQDFTVADLNLASMFTMATGAKLDLAEYPNVKAWVERCFGRPAFKKLAAKRT